MAIWDSYDYEGSGNDDSPNRAAQKRAYLSSIAPPGMVPLSAWMNAPEGFNPASTEYGDQIRQNGRLINGQWFVTPAFDKQLNDRLELVGQDPIGNALTYAPFAMAGGLLAAGPLAGGLAGLSGTAGPEALIGSAGVDTLGAAAGAFPTTAAEIAAANQAAAAAIGEGVATGTSGALGAGGLSEGILQQLMQAFQSAPPGATTALQALTQQGGGNSLSDFQSTLQQSGVMGDSGGLSELFNSIDGGGSGGLNYANLLRGALQGGLGYLGAGQQQDAYKDVYNQQMAIGAPFRQKLEASYAPGFDLKTADPLYGNALTQSAEEATRTVSAKSGNPYGNPGAMAEIQNSVMNRTALPYASNYRGQLGQFGGLGLNTAGTASLAGANTAGGGLNAIGYGLGTALEDDNDDQYTRLAKAIQGGQYKLSLG